MSEYLLDMRGIVKDFNGVKALDGINLKVRPGEVVGLCGENGAGKSTLMKVLSAVYPYGNWQGQIFWEGKELKAASIRETEHAGIVIIHQELMLVPQLSVAENIFMGNEITLPGGLMNYEAMYKRSEELMAELKMPDVNVALPVYHYGGGHQQLIEIAKAINKKAKLLILDEPTSSLTQAETQILLDIILDLKRKGVACVMISHKLDEVAAVCDTVSVIRDGTHVGTRPMREIDTNEIITMMVGREIKNPFPARGTSDRGRDFRGAPRDLSGREQPAAQACRRCVVPVAQGRDSRHRRAGRCRAYRVGDGRLWLLSRSLCG